MEKEDKTAATFEVLSRFRRLYLGLSTNDYQKIQGGNTICTIVCSNDQHVNMNDLETTSIRVISKR